MEEFHLQFALIANLRKKLFWEQLPYLLNWFKKEKVNIAIAEDIVQASQFPIKDFPTFSTETLNKQSRFDMILAFGGDGTILRTVQLVGEAQIPILGVNVGGLGFLTEIPLEKFEVVFKDILQGKYYIENRLMLEARIDTEKKPVYALNEITIEKGGSPRVIQIRTQVDGRYLNNYIADGLIVSTPTGSTGYSLSTGGPIVIPSARVIIINPISPHSLTNRPVIVPDATRVDAVVYTESPQFLVAGDGRDVRYCPSRTHLQISKASFSARLVKHEKSDFFALLNSKLRWGEDFRDKSRWTYDS